MNHNKLSSPIRYISSILTLAANRNPKAYGRVALLLHLLGVAFRNRKLRWFIISVFTFFFGIVALLFWLIVPTMIAFFSDLLKSEQVRTLLKGIKEILPIS